MFRIKICGVTTPGDALLAAAAGADAIGLNFYPQSPRYVEPARAAEIAHALRARYSADQIRIFGVFVNASLDDILSTIRDANLYGVEQGFGVQLHGDESPELIRQLLPYGIGPSGHLLQATGDVPVVPVLRAFRWPGGDLGKEQAYLTRCQELGALPQAVLIDAAGSGRYGGTGIAVDWPALARQRQRLLGLPLVLAGGLTPENVAQAIATVRPDAVDVASGVESCPGCKDAAKVAAFVAAARRAFQL